MMALIMYLILSANACAATLLSIASGFEKPVDIQFPPGKSQPMYVVEQVGRVKVVEPNKPPRTILSLKVLYGDELGLLGLAFHPRYAENQRFYVNYNPDDSGPRRTRISEFVIGKDGLPTERTILEFDQPYSNHNGGGLAFGPDGFLYIGTGDGGGMGDPDGNGQKTDTLLGKMLRIDVDHMQPDKRYAIPSDNPFASKAGYRREIWALGLRNPWRYSFDKEYGLIVGDVGQNKWEEVTILRAGDNAGWSIKEGTHCYKPPKNCQITGLREPVLEYGHDEGATVVGGYVYRGSAIPSLRGKYIYGDYVVGKIWSADLKTRKTTLLGRWPMLISTFGRDAEGELYVANIAEGTISKLSP